MISGMARNGIDALVATIASYPIWPAWLAHSSRTNSTRLGCPILGRIGFRLLSRGALEWNESAVRRAENVDAEEYDQKHAPTRTDGSVARPQ